MSKYDLITSINTCLARPVCALRAVFEARQLRHDAPLPAGDGEEQVRPGDQHEPPAADGLPGLQGSEIKYGTIE